MTSTQNHDDERATRSGSWLADAAAPVLFLVGLLVLAAMGFVAAWPDMEASVFDAGTSLAADANLPSLRCPWLVTEDETAIVKAKLTNRADRPESFLVRSRITRGFLTLVRQDRQQVKLAPGETVELSWPATAEDAAYRRLIMVRVLATRSPVNPAREGYCGILVVGVSGVGGQWLYMAGVLVGLALLGGGAWLWLRPRKPLGRRDYETARRYSVLAAIVVVSLVTGMASLWLVSHVLLVAAILFSFLLLEQAYAR